LKRNNLHTHTHTHTHTHARARARARARTQDVTKIISQTLKAYSSHCKDEKSHINVGTLPFQVINIVLFYTYTYILFYTYVFVQWTSIIEDFLLGPIFLSILNGKNYRQFLETQFPLILEDVSLQIRNQI